MNLPYDEIKIEPGNIKRIALEDFFAATTDPFIELDDWIDAAKKLSVDDQKFIQEKMDIPFQIGDMTYNFKDVYDKPDIVEKIINDKSSLTAIGMAADKLRKTVWYEDADKPANDQIISEISKKITNDTNIYISVGPGKRLEFIFPPFILNQVASDSKYHIFIIEPCNERGAFGCFDDVTDGINKILDENALYRKNIKITWINAFISKESRFHELFFNDLMLNLKDKLNDMIVPVYWGLSGCGSVDPYSNEFSRLTQQFNQLLVFGCDGYVFRGQKNHVEYPSSSKCDIYGRPSCYTSHTQPEIYNRVLKGEHIQMGGANVQLGGHADKFKLKYLKYKKKYLMLKNGF